MSLNFHTNHCNALAVDPNNRFFVSGGTDSVIAIWDFDDFICSGTISTNDLKVKNLSLSADGTQLGALFFDEFHKKYLLDIYDMESSK